MPDEKVEMTGTFGSNPKFFVAGEIYDRGGNVVDPGECIIFKVTDKALIATLNEYILNCNNLEHQHSAIDLQVEVARWQAENPDRVKAAD